MTIVPQTFIKDTKVKNDIYEMGYSIVGNIGKEVLGQLLNFYSELHSIKTSEGAMFYSIYSQDIDYRVKVHNSLGQILKNTLNKYFDEDKYKNVINSFIIKSPGKKSEFALHQDSTIIDESKYSQLSLWIPLQDTTLENGTLCFVPGTHQFFAPYRANTITPPYSDYEDELRKYLKPIDLKAGDILAFDYRLVHYSPANKTKNDRVVVLCGLFEKEAGFEVAYQENPTDLIEIYSQDDDYLLTNKGFHIACNCRPETGKKIREVKYSGDNMTLNDFLRFTKEKGLEKINNSILQKKDLDSFTVTDPKYKPGFKKIINDRISALLK